MDNGISTNVLEEGRSDSYLTSGASACLSVITDETLMSADTGIRENPTIWGKYKSFGDSIRSISLFVKENTRFRILIADRFSAPIDR